MSIKILLAGVALTTGCYEAILAKDINPPKPPTLVDGAQVSATDETELGKWHFNSSGDFVQHHYRVGKATYNGEPLSIPRLAAIADPEKWQKDVAHAQDLHTTCRHGVGPEYVAYGFTIAAMGLGIGLTSESGGAGYNAMSSNEKLALYATGAAAASAAIAYTIGYFRGGSACDELKSFRAQIHIDDKDEDVEANGDEVDLINHLASHFNANHGGPAVAPTESPADESSSN